MAIHGREKVFFVLKMFLCSLHFLNLFFKVIMGKEHTKKNVTFYKMTMI